MATTKRGEDAGLDPFAASWWRGTIVRERARAGQAAARLDHRAAIRQGRAPSVSLVGRSWLSA